MRRLLATLLPMLALAALLVVAACVRRTGEAAAKKAPTPPPTAVAPGADAKDAADAVLAADDLVSNGAVDGRADGDRLTGSAYRTAPAAPAATASSVFYLRADEAAGAPARPGGGAAPAQPIPPSERDDDGLLTAAAWDDARHPESLAKFLEKTTSEGAEWVRLHDACAGVRTFRVVDRSGRPLGGARISIEGRDPSGAQRIVTLTTRSDGRAVLVPALAGLDPQAQWRVQTEFARVTRSGPPTGEDVRLALDAQAVTGLDLALVVDCTGSMGDELGYIQRELDAIVSGVMRHHAGLTVRVAVVAYRDHGDEFVVRTTPFAAVSVAREELAKLTAAGGGDEPEAVEEAMAAAAALEWRAEPSVARVALHFGDAPPHAGRERALLDASAKLAEEGVAIYPVAGSGIDASGEALFRLEALLTGARYCWLTDDSGIGDAHAEPHVPWYRVEKLTALLTRLIDGEIAGRSIPAEPGKVLRTVGSPPPEGDAVAKRAAFGGGSARAVPLRDGLWLIEWGQWNTLVRVADGRAAVTTFDHDGNELVRYEAPASTDDAGAIAIDATGVSPSGPEAARWSADSFAIGVDGTVAAVDNLDQRAKGTAAKGGAN